MISLSCCDGWDGGARRRRAFRGVSMRGALVLAAALSWSASAQEAARSTSRDAALPFETPACSTKFLHMRLELTITRDDMDQKTAHGVVTHRVHVPGGAKRQLRLDAVDLRIEKVERGSPDALAEGAQRGGNDSRNWREAPFESDGKQLVIQLPDAAENKGESGTDLVRITYSVNSPKLGLHFVLPRNAEDDRPVMVYSMSEPLQARYWLPCHDWPDTRWPSDIYIHVPPPFSGVSVGEPVVYPAGPGDVQAGAKAGLRTFHWRQTDRIDPHMFGFAVGEFMVLRDEWRGRPVLAYIHPKYEKAARYSFRRVPQMLEFYSQLTGVDYPWPQFAHVGVTDHFHGGMEHVGFDMIAPSLLAEGEGGRVPPEAAEFNYVAHMLGHQWFGGLVNYRRIYDAWLNEGFATYFHQLWRSKAYPYDAWADGPPGDAPSEDWLLEDMWNSANQVAQFDKGGETPPMVHEGIKRAEEIYTFGAGMVYWKGAWVLHMLRGTLGETGFRDLVREYVTRHRGASVETVDLVHAVAAHCEKSGRMKAMEAWGGVDGFFDQWVYRSGIPDLHLQTEWDDAARTLVLELEQRQRVDEDNPAFRFPLEIAIAGGGQEKRELLGVSERRHRFEFKLPSRPYVVATDPDLRLLKSIREDKPLEMWVNQLRHGPTAYARSAAVQNLGRAVRDNKASAEAVIPCLTDCLKDGNLFWGTRRRAASVLSEIDSEQARRILTEVASTVRNPRIRSAIRLADQ